MLIVIRAVLSAIVTGVLAVSGHPVTTNKPAALTPMASVAKPYVPPIAHKYSTGTATQLITVTAKSGSSTTATLAAWTLTVTKSGKGWKEVFGPITAHLGADGVGRASETTSRTPAGSFTLTRAFGALKNPGTAVPYTKTDSYDWWISQSGRLYNTFQRCTQASCGFTRGNPNEHLYYETPYYNYAVVIDYNRTPVVQGAGSAFFLHVTDGHPTAGCVSIPQADLVAIMRWLKPADHPRIVIGVS